MTGYAAATVFNYAILDVLSGYNNLALAALKKLKAEGKLHNFSLFIPEFQPLRNNPEFRKLLLAGEGQ